MPEDTQNQVVPTQTQQSKGKWYKPSKKRSIFIISAVLLLLLGLWSLNQSQVQNPGDSDFGFMLIGVSPLLIIGGVFVRSVKSALLVFGIPVLLLILYLLYTVFVIYPSLPPIQ